MAQWFIAAKKADFEDIAVRYRIDPVLARIIRNRDVSGEEEIRKYLYGGREDLYAPGLMKDMDRAAELICNKIAGNAKIRIIGDYDADGICAAYILKKVLTVCGADADTVIPHRIKDGYGLNNSLIEEAIEDKVDTILTCDNGIAAAEQIAYAKEQGITVIITDHHEVPYEEAEDGSRNYFIPDADAVIDPKQEGCPYPYKNICGAAVAYKLAGTLLDKMKPEKAEDIMEELLEIAALATVCDVMELRDENRIMVKCGLENMRHTRNTGLKALIEVCGLEGKKLSAYHLGFIIGPCLNATGRLDTAERALTLLQCENRAETVLIAAELKALNEKRKEMTLQKTEEAVGIIENDNLKKDKILVVFMPECHESLAGIIAGRLREKYGKPSFVLTKGEDGIKGSGRSIEAYSMYEALSECKDLFTKFGGHRMAAGLSMEEEKVGEFRQRLNKNCRLGQPDFEERVHIDIALPFAYATKEFIKELEILEPFGVGNAKPVFAQKDIHLIRERIMGKNRNAAKYDIRDAAGGNYEMIFFGDLEVFHDFLLKRAGKEAAELIEGRQSDIQVNITYYPSINSYNGRESIQLVMQNYC